MEISRSDVMLGYVESYYRESLFYTAQNNAKGKELDIIHAIIEDMPNQFNPQTATWGLGLWEEMLGITMETENIADRRSRVMMKLLTLQRITPISLERLIKNVAGANVDIIRNVAPYTFQVCVRNDSLNCDSALIWKIIEENKEAHMAYYQGYNLVGGKVFVRQAEIITFTMAFYPLFNLPKLRLTSRWKLNGRKKLSGYDGSGRIDLYPVGMEFAVPVREAPREAAQLSFLLGVQEQAESGQEMEIKTFAVCMEDVKEEFTLQASARTEVKAGNATLYNAHRLDGKRKLNGSLKLNGGFYQL